MEYTTSSIWWVRKKTRVISQPLPWSWIHAALKEGDGGPVARRRCSGLVSGEEVGGEMADGEGAYEQCERGRKAASVGNAGFF